MIDGRANIVNEVAEAESGLKTFVTTSIGRLMEDADFDESLSGQLPLDAASQARLPSLRQKLRLIAAV